MYATVVAPKGKKAAHIRLVREAGLTVHSGEYVYLEKAAARAAAPIITRLVQQGALQCSKIGNPPTDPQPRRLFPLIGKVAQVAPSRVLETVVSGTPRLFGGLGVYQITPEAAQMELLRRGQLPQGLTLSGSHLGAVLANIGHSGEQNEADESRYFETWHDGSFDKRLNVAEIDTIDVLPDYSAALVTRHVYTMYHRALRSSSVECYLVVRDTTTKDRHVLRVPPKFGSRKSVTRQTILETGGPAAVIHAAIAWTFGLKPDQYQPDVAA